MEARCVADTIRIKTRMRVRELAEARGLDLATFQREAKLPVSTARRYWYSTEDGSPNGEPLKRVNMETIDKLSEFFGCPPGDLFQRVNE
jgi:DNA-binding Xre family transcriptional regulator